MTGANLDLSFSKFFVKTVDQAEDLIRRLSHFADGVNVKMQFTTVIVVGRDLTNQDLQDIFSGKDITV